MNKFKKFFGTDENSIKRNCVICPSNDASLFLGPGKKTLYKGMFYSVADAGSFCVISTKYNFLAGDLLLYLKNTQCENAWLFGSCGVIKGAEVGDMVVPVKSANLESFSTMLEFPEKLDEYYPDGKMMGDFALYAKNEKIIRLNCATVGSLFLEDKYPEYFRKNKIGCVDMESSAIFAAAKNSGIKAMALFYCSDVVGKKPFYGEFSGAERAKKELSRKRLAAILAGFIENV